MKELENVTYLAPELLVGGNPTSFNYEKADVYSFGTLLLYIMSQQDIPEKLLRKRLTAHGYYFYHFTLLTVYLEFAHRIVGGLSLEIPADIHPRLITLITSCHDAEPKKRPDMSEVIKVLDFLYSTSAPSKLR